MLKKRSFFFPVLIIFFLSFLFSQNVFAIAIISDPIEIDNALRGEVIEELFSIFNSEETERIYELKGEGEIADWISFYKKDDLDTQITQVLAPPQVYYDMVVFITIPDDVPNGDYQGKLTTVLAPVESEEEGTRVSVTQRLSRQVSIKVTDEENVVFNVSVIPLTYGVKKNESLSVRFIYNNKGNVTVRPQIDFKIKKDDQVVYNAIFPYPENEPGVRPSAQYEIPAVEIPTSNLKPDTYLVEVEFLHNGQVVTHEQFRFSVLQGGLAGLVKGVSDINWRVNWWIFALAIILVVAAIITMALKKNKKSVF